MSNYVSEIILGFQSQAKGNFRLFSGIRIKDEFFVNGCPKSGKSSDCSSGSLEIRKKW